MLSAVIRYRPLTLRGLYAVLEHAARERFLQTYMADTLYLLARAEYTARGVEYPLEAFSAIESERTKPKDTRTAQDIADELISRLTGGDT